MNWVARGSLRRRGVPRPRDRPRTSLEAEWRRAARCRGGATRAPVLGRRAPTPARARRGRQTSICSSRPAGTPLRAHVDLAPRRLPAAGAAVHRLVDGARRAARAGGRRAARAAAPAHGRRRAAQRERQLLRDDGARAARARRVGRPVPARTTRRRRTRARRPRCRRPTCWWRRGAIPRTRSTSAPPAGGRRGAGRRAAAGAARLLRGLDGACGADVRAVQRAPRRRARHAPERRLARRSARAGCSGAPPTSRARPRRRRARGCAGRWPTTRGCTRRCARRRGRTRAATRRRLRLEAVERVLNSDFVHRRA